MAHSGGVVTEPRSSETELAPVRPGEQLDWARIDAWLRANAPRDLALGAGPEVLQFPNGAANLTYLLRYEARELVLRRPPFGVIAPGAHDMRREFKVLSRLWRHTRLAPRAVAFCEDKSVCGADFFVMERRTGVVARASIPEPMRHHENAGRRMGFAIADAMAELHSLDPAQCDLADLGKPEGFAARQVAGWRKRWELVRPASAARSEPQASEAKRGSEARSEPQASEVDEMDAVADRLAARVPAAQRTSFVHNDLKPDNCQFDPADPDRCKSIFDWDMTTLGDPLIDLGTLIQYWPDAGDPSFRELSSHPGMLDMGLPPRAEIAARYAERTGADLTALPWWVAFAYWKTAVVCQQLYTRYARGESKDARMVAIGARVPVLAARASEELRRAGM
ncbi:MAG: phosphotransferase family protein [Deltaproteobacteria bacterium]|nr:phosphotransferase family protein [Deltaproteobacteria bacterium]